MRPMQSKTVLSFTSIGAQNRSSAVVRTHGLIQSTNASRISAAAAKRICRVRNAGAGVAAGTAVAGSALTVAEIGTTETGAVFSGISTNRWIALSEGTRNSGT